MSDFITLETRMLYKIDYGGQSAPIHTSLSYGPERVPYMHSIDDANLVFKWDFLRKTSLSEAGSGRPPKWLKVHLFKPRDPGHKPPPPPVSDDSSGHILRGSGKQKEDSDLWKNYINIYYLPVDGVDVIAYSREDLNADRANTSWPGQRRSHMSYFVGTIFEAGSGTGGPSEWITVEEIPMRVSAIVGEDPQIFLILTEIKRTKRLKLDVFQYEVRYISSRTLGVIERSIASGSSSVQEVERDYGIRFEVFERFSEPVDAPPPVTGGGVPDPRRKRGKK